MNLRLIFSAAAAVCMFAASTATAKEPAEPDPIHDEFVRQDGDSDGVLTREEIRAYLRMRIPADRLNDDQLNAMVQQAFTTLDVNANGTVTFEEYKSKTRLRRRRTDIPRRDLRLFEGRFSQCSFNALSSVLIHFYGPTPMHQDRKAFEKRTFHEPLSSMKFGGYYGWAPWTGYMVESDAVIWNQKVTDLSHENFALRPKKDPVADIRARTITVHYAEGEREKLEAKLISQLKRGPVVIWTPYAAVITKDAAKRWEHVTHTNDTTDVVPFGPFTHAVTLFLKDDGRIMVSDGAVRDGIFYTDARTIVATASAMTGFIRIPNPKGKTVLERIKGIENEQYNVVFWRDGDE